jgi:hypothetical protein
VSKEPEVYTAGVDKIDEFSKEKLDYFVKSVTDKKIPLVVIVSPMYVQPFKENYALTLSKQNRSKIWVTGLGLFYRSAFCQESTVL